MAKKSKTSKKASSTSANDAKAMADLAKAEENRKATEAKNAANMAAAAQAATQTVKAPAVSTPTVSNTSSVGTSNNNTASVGTFKPLKVETLQAPQKVEPVAKPVAPAAPQQEASSNSVSQGTITTQDGQTLEAPKSIAEVVKEYIANYQPEPQRQFDFNKARDDFATKIGNIRDTSKANAQQLYDSGIATQESNYANGIEDINKQTDDALRQAYISNMLNQRNLSSQLANAGINGGATETVMANLLNNYQNNRNNIYDAQSNNIRDLNIANNAAKDELYRTLLSANAQADGNYLQTLADYERDVSNMQYNADESALDRYLQMRGQDINNFMTASTADASNAIDWNKIINGNDQNFIDWLNKYGYQLNDQTWQSGENFLDRLLTATENQNDRDFKGTESEKDRNFSSIEKEKDRTFTSSENDKDRNLTSTENALDRYLQSLESDKRYGWESSENALDRDFKRELEQMGIDASMAELLTKLGYSVSGGSGGNAETAYTDNNTVTNNGMPVAWNQTLKSPENIAKNSADVGVGTTAAEAKKALASSNEHYSTVAQGASNVWGSTHSLAEVTNYIQQKVFNGFLTDTLGAKILSDYLTKYGDSVTNSNNGGSNGIYINKPFTSNQLN